MSLQVAFLSIISATLLIISAALLILAIKVGRDARKTRELVHNARSELSNALDKIYSTDPDQIRSGLQILAVLRDKDLQIKVLPRLTQLVVHDNPRVAAQAKATVEKMTSN